MPPCFWIRNADRSRRRAGGWPPRVSSSGRPGNVSARERTSASRSRPTGAVLAELEPEQVTVVDLDGRRRRRASSSPPRSSTCTSASTAATAPARSCTPTRRWPPRCRCVLDELPCVHYQMLLLGGAVRVAPYADLRHARARRRPCSTRSRAARAALMANHGAIAHAGDAGRRRVELVAAARVGMHRLLARRRDRRRRACSTRSSARP